MKKLLTLALTALVLCGCSSKTPTTENTACEVEVKEVPVAVSDYTDSYASASSTRIPLVGDDFTAGIDALQVVHSDLATIKDSKAEGYTRPEAKYAQVMSVNPDGSVSMSTIHAWKVDKTEDGATVTIVMTDGQTIQNLVKAIGTRGTIMVHGDKYYNMHVQTKDIVALEYSDEAFEEGLFNMDYSGAEHAATEYTVTFDIYSLEGSFVYIFD